MTDRVVESSPFPSAACLPAAGMKIIYEQRCASAPLSPPYKSGGRSRSEGRAPPAFPLPARGVIHLLLKVKRSLRGQDNHYREEGCTPSLAGWRQREPREGCRHPHPAAFPSAHPQMKPSLPLPGLSLARRHPAGTRRQEVLLARAGAGCSALLLCLVSLSWCAACGPGEQKWLSVSIQEKGASRSRSAH